MRKYSYNHRTLVCQFFTPKIALNAVICMNTYIFLDNGVMTTLKHWILSFIFTVLCYNCCLLENAFCMMQAKHWHLQYHSKVSWQSLETRYSKLDSQSSILKNFEDRGSSRVSRRWRLFENLSRPFENLSSWVSTLSSGKKTKDFSRN